MNCDSAPLSISDGAKEKMEGRGISEADLRQVLAAAENGGDKLASGDGKTYLGKLRIGNFTVYAEYAADGDCFAVNSVYSHMVSLSADKQS